MPGTLFVVATPIGNLEDLTFRALRILQEVELIAAEDTRRTAKLLAHYGIRRPVISLRQHNEGREAGRIVARITSGQSVALVSDAGTPGISDPGAVLVRAVRHAGLRVVPIPGPSAVAAALSISGFSGDGFVFFGFPPASGSARSDWFAQVAMEDRISVLFEAPHRLRRTLSELRSLLVDRPIMVCRELTKINEVSGITPNIWDDSNLTRELGESTLVIGPRSTPSTPPDPARAVSLIGHLTETAGLSELEACQVVGCLYGVRPEAIRKILKKARISAKQHGPPSP